MVPCKSTAKEVLFEWSRHGISSTDSKVRTTLHVSIIDSGNERVYIKVRKITDAFDSPVSCSLLPGRYMRLSRMTCVVSASMCAMRIY